MKENLKLIGMYLAKLVQVLIMAPLMWIKIAVDTLFEVLLVLLFATFGDDDSLSSSWESLRKRIEE